MKKYVKFIFYMFLIVNLMLVFNGCSNESKVTKNTVPIDKFIKGNHVSFNNLKKGNKLFSLMDRDLKGKEIYLSGETHGVSENYQLRFSLIKYFKEKAGIKYILMEDSYSGTEMLNDYLKSGDIRILDRYFKYYSYTNYIYNKDNYNNFKEIYKYNKALPDNQKLKFVGIDIEHCTGIAFQYLKSTIPKNEAPKDIASILNELKSVNGNIIARDESKDLCLKIEKSIDENKNTYEEYFKDKLFGFRLVCDNIINAADDYSNEKSNDTFNKMRDEDMYNNLLKLHNKLPKGRYFGQFGSYHVFQHEIYDVKWFTSLLNTKGSALRGKILSICYLYSNCEAIDAFNKSTEYINTYQESQLDNYLTGRYNMFKLTGKGSPFSNSSICPAVDISSNNDNATTDFYQYMIVIKNGIAVKRLIN